LMPVDPDTGGWWWWGENNEYGSRFGKVLANDYLNQQHGLVSGILRCPADNNDPKTFAWMVNSLSYAYNWHIGNFKRRMQVAKPEDKIMFADGFFYGLDQYGAATDISYRHKRSANIVYMDGHNGRMRMSEYSISTNLGTYGNP
jgi:prepilin-type processing-associated H-X9-DG protein